MDIKICDFCSEPYNHHSYSLRLFDNKSSVDLVGHDECVDAAEDLVKREHEKLSLKETLKVLGIKGK